MRSTGEESAMNAKFSIAIVAAMFAVPASYAAQPFGRDSVYVTPDTHITKSNPSAVPVVRYGRDSVYVSQGPVSRGAPSTQQTEVTYKAGRA